MQGCQRSVFQEKTSLQPGLKPSSVTQISHPHWGMVIHLRDMLPYRFSNLTQGFWTGTQALSCKAP